MKRKYYMKSWQNVSDQISLSKDCSGEFAQSESNYDMTLKRAIVDFTLYSLYKANTYADAGTAQHEKHALYCTYTDTTHPRGVENVVVCWLLNVPSTC